MTRTELHKEAVQHNRILRKFQRRFLRTKSVEERVIATMRYAAVAAQLLEQYRKDLNTVAGDSWGGRLTNASAQAGQRVEFVDHQVRVVSNA